MPDIDRRSLIAAGTAIGIGTIAGQSAAAAPPPAAAFTPQPLPLPFDPKAVTGLPRSCS